MDGMYMNRQVHQLVLEAFVGPRPDGTEACHNNGTRTDNNLANLRWDTRKSNHADKKKHGTEWAPKGALNGMSKLCAGQALEIVALGRAGVNRDEIAEKFGVSRGTVTSIIHGKSWACLKEAS